MVLKFLEELYGWIMWISIKRKKKRMKRHSKRRGRNVVFAVLSRRVNAIGDLDVNSLMMNK